MMGEEAGDRDSDLPIFKGEEFCSWSLNTTGQAGLGDSIGL